MYQPLQSLSANRAIAIPARACETLIMEGEPCNGILELRCGLVRAVNFSSEGNRQIMAFFFPGDLLGLPLADEHRFSAEAVSDVIYTKQSIRTWEADLAACHSPSGCSPLRAIWQEEKAFMARGLILGRGAVMARLAAFLAYAVRRLPVENGAYDFSVPQSDVASFIATSPETVCRLMRQLREMRVIKTPRKNRLEILDAQRLEALANGVSI